MRCIRPSLLALCTCLPLFAETIRVPEDFQEIQMALDWSRSGDEVLVAPGLYTIDDTIRFPGRRITLRSEAGPAVTTIRMSSRRPGAASVLALTMGEGPETVVEGFTIAGGKAERGGGILVRNAAPTIRGNWIIGNEATSAGGGIAIENPAGLTLEGNRIEGNRVVDPAGKGGGIYVEGRKKTEDAPAPWLVIDRCEISRNSAGEGGGIYLEWVGGTISDCLVDGNEASRGGGAVWHNEGSSSALLASIRGCRFLRNRSAGHGGGIIISAGDRTHSYIQDCAIEKNKAERRGGGVFLPLALRTWIQRNRFCENEAGLDGGGLYVERRRTENEGLGQGAVVERNVFFGNGASRRGGGVYLGILAESRFEFNSVVANWAEHSGGGLVSGWWEDENRAEPLHDGWPWLIANSLIWGNEAPGLEIGSPDIAIDGINRLFFCFVEQFQTSRGVTLGNSEDPQLVDVAAGDLHLKPTSPLIDAAHPAAPLDPDGTRADVGAFWYPHRTRFIRGDVDGDGEISLGDAVMLLEYLFAGRLLPCPKACDVDDDGRTTLTDPIRLLHYLFAGGAPPPAPFPAEGVDPTADELRCVR